MPIKALLIPEVSKKKKRTGDGKLVWEVEGSFWTSLRRVNCVIRQHDAGGGTLFVLYIVSMHQRRIGRQDGFSLAGSSANAVGKTGRGCSVSHRRVRFDA
jgi:hypothetical protein